MIVNYYQLVTLVEANQKVLNASGLAMNQIFFVYIVIILGQPSLLCLKNLFKYFKRNRSNKKNSDQVQVLQ